MKRKGYLPYVGLPNIIAGEFVVPELLQDAATPQALASAVVDLLNDAPRRQRSLPLASRVSSIDLEAHRSFIATMGDKAIWPDYLPAGA